MCTKFFSDGDVHRYFNPYESPYDAFVNYMNVLSDFAYRLNKAPKIEIEESIEDIEKKIAEHEIIIRELKTKLQAKKAPKVISETKPDAKAISESKKESVAISATKKKAKLISKTKKAAIPIDKKKAEEKVIDKTKDEPKGILEP